MLRGDRGNPQMFFSGRLLRFASNGKNTTGYAPNIHPLKL